MPSLRVTFRSPVRTVDKYSIRTFSWSRADPLRAIRAQPRLYTHRQRRRVLRANRTGRARIIVRGSWHTRDRASPTPASRSLASYATQYSPGLPPNPQAAYLAAIVLLPQSFFQGIATTAGAGGPIPQRGGETSGGRSCRPGAPRGEGIATLPV